MPDTTTLNRDPPSLPSGSPKTCPVVSAGRANGQPGSIVELHLTSEQEARLAPIVRNAVLARSNVLFIAEALPRNGSWFFQAMTITASTGAKLRRLLDADKEEPPY